MIAKPDSISRLVDDLRLRRARLGMTFEALSAISGVSVPTVKRAFSRDAARVSIGAMDAIVRALGGIIGAGFEPAERVRAKQARLKAERLVRLVQGNAALEGQGVGARAREDMVERTARELLTGSGRRLWSA